MVQDRFGWPHLVHNVKNYINDYNACQHLKTPTTKPTGQVQRIQILNPNWEYVSIDFINDITPFLKVWCNFDCIHKLGKMPHFMATSSQMTTNCMNVFKILRFPWRIINDMDARFMSKFWIELCHLIGRQLAMFINFHRHTYS